MFIHQYIPGKAAYTVLLLHGTGGDENDLVGIGRSLAPGAGLLSPRGKVVENGAPRFFRRLSPGVFDLDDVRLRAGELAMFVKESAHQYAFDAGRVYALGYSNGANIAAAMMLLYPDVLAGGVLLRAMPTLEPVPLPDLSEKPVLIVAGEEDAMTTHELTGQAAAVLSRAGAAVEVKWVVAGHELTPYDFQVVQGYFTAL